MRESGLHQIDRADSRTKAGYFVNLIWRSALVTSPIVRCFAKPVQDEMLGSFLLILPASEKLIRQPSSYFGHEEDKPHYHDIQDDEGRDATIDINRADLRWRGTA